MNKVLIISTEYPPAAKSSGVQRIVNFSKYLTQFQWTVNVLTMHPRAYGENIVNNSFDEVEGVEAKRATAFNTAIHFSIKGRYLSWMALPDRWSSWVFFGFLSGKRLIKKHQPSVIFSSYPHASAHLLALLLHRATGVSLVADFRDPMLYLNENITGLRYKLYHWIEKNVIKSCDYAIFTTESAIENYIKVKYPDEPEDKFYLIENGFDEADFQLAEKKLLASTQEKIEQIVLLHSGGIFPEERNPSSLLQAIADLVASKLISAETFRVILRAPGDESYCQEIIDLLGLQTIVSVEPKLPYQDALVEMLSVDGLLIMQDSCCNFQVPAKVYEYFRANKPIVALTDIKGETAKLLIKSGMNNIAPLNDSSAIFGALMTFITEVENQEISSIPPNILAQFSRQEGAKKLANLLSLVAHTKADV